MAARFPTRFRISLRRRYTRLHCTFFGPFAVRAKVFALSTNENGVHWTRTTVAGLVKILGKA